MVLKMGREIAGKLQTMNVKRDCWERGHSLGTAWFGLISQRL